MKSAHSQRLENWLGKDALERVSRAMCGPHPESKWYGPPIALSGVPGAVYATRDGDFIGYCDAGQFGNAYDRAEDTVRRLARMLRARVARGVRVHHGALYAGFASLSDLIAEATAGKRREWTWAKSGTVGVLGSTNTLWRVGTFPAAGGSAAAAPGGEAPTDATTGAMPFDNVSTDTRHIVSAWTQASANPRNLLLYDRIFAVDKTMNSTATEAVTGVPTRYQSITQGAADSAEGNFLFMECHTALPATAHNWTVCLYEDQGGTTGAILPSVTGNASNIINRNDMPAFTWFAPLASGDTGISDLEQMQCSALVATGVINFVIGHPLAWMANPLANALCVYDYIGTAFNLARIFDDAALAWLDVMAPGTTATTFSMGITAVHG